MIRITDGRYIRTVYGTPVVVDIFRSSTTIVTLLLGGVQEIVPVKTTGEAFALKEEGYVLVGEEDTKKIEGFDYGNSPSELSTINLDSKKVVLKTSNGTNTIIAAGEGALIGSFLNITELSRHLRNKEIQIFPSNTRGGVATEDNEFSYALSKRILEPGSDINVNLQRARTGNGSLRLKEHNLLEDLEYCLQTDTTEVIPIYKEGIIRKL